jgi:capsular polysaccharide biosynthesis protein
MERRIARSSAYRVPPVEVFRLDNAYVETGACIAIKNGAFVLDTFQRTLARAAGFSCSDDARTLTMPNRCVAGTLGHPAVLVGVPKDNYFHWLFEAVARWLFARDLVDERWRLLVPPGHGAMRAASLDVVGVRRDRVAVMPRRVLLPVGQLLVPQRGVVGAASIFPAAVEALRVAFTYGGNLKERLFVSRAGAGKRRIANEDEVLAVVRRHGFSVVDPGGLTVRAQARRFQDASIVLGVHGAGLANCAHSPAGAILIELQPPGIDPARMVLYWRLAAAARQRYAQIVCAEAPGQAAVSPAQRDVRVHTGHLDATLSRILN